MPNVIILFGSASKGEDLQESDLDIFMECEETKLNLLKYEKIINRKINILFNPKFNNLSNELKNNIMNGIILKGYIKLF
jgi:predicted nucleotidyltransferase